MKRYWFLPILAVAGLMPALSQKSGSPFDGRWDITITAPTASGGTETYPDWMEVVESNGPQVRVQPRGGSVHPVTTVKIDGSHMTLVLNAATGKRPETTWDLTVEKGKLTGAQKRGEEVTGQIAGVRAPELNRKPPKAWADPEPIFNGKDLTGWVPDDPATNHWVAKDGVLLNESHGANLRTVQKFQDFKLHIEFNCPDGGNSGIYLRGRDEIQVAYEKPGVNDKFHDMGAIYGYIAPSVELPRKPGEWEVFDVTLVGRHVTVIRNGVKTIDNQEIPGPSGGAIDANEAEPGPFYLQGDHTGGMMYRNITVSLAK